MGFACWYAVRTMKIADNMFISAEEGKLASARYTVVPSAYRDMHPSLPSH